MHQGLRNVLEGGGKYLPVFDKLYYFISFYFPKVGMVGYRSLSAMLGQIVSTLTHFELDQ